MAFKELGSPTANKTISIGGRDKSNPTELKGYFLGARTIPDAKKKSGISHVYTFETREGVVDVWGKTDLDNKMKDATLGALTHIVQEGTRPTPNGEMFLYRVRVDCDNVREESSARFEVESDDGFEETDVDAEETPMDQVKPAYFAAPKGPVATPSAALKSHAEALLSKSRAKN